MAITCPHNPSRNSWRDRRQLPELCRSFGWSKRRRWHPVQEGLGNISALSVCLLCFALRREVVWRDCQLRALFVVALVGLVQLSRGIVLSGAGAPKGHPSVVAFCFVSATDVLGGPCVLSTDVCMFAGTSAGQACCRICSPCAFFGGRTCMRRPKVASCWLLIMQTGTGGGILSSARAQVGKMQG